MSEEASCLILPNKPFTAAAARVKMAELCRNFLTSSFTLKLSKCAF